MEITEIRITLRSEPKLKAFANVTFDNSFVVRGLKIIEGSNGLFISMPSRKAKDGTYRDIAHPRNNEMRKKIEEAVISEYKKKFKEEGGSGISEDTTEDTEDTEDTTDDNKDETIKDETIEEVEEQE